MFKMFLKSILILALTGMLFSCGSGMSHSKSELGGDGIPGDGNRTGSKEIPGDSVTMTATVTALGDKLEVEVTESEYTFGTYWVITDSTKFYDKLGNEISKSDIKVGDSVKIYYGGQVMLSYPPQIVAAKIFIQ